MKKQSKLKDYKKCLAWKVQAGCAEMCYDFCSQLQRNYCIESQDNDEENLTVEKSLNNE